MASPASGRYNRRPLYPLATATPVKKLLPSVSLISTLPVFLSVSAAALAIGHAQKRLVLIHLFIVILGAKISSNIYARDIRDTFKMNDPRAKLRTAKAYLAARPYFYLIVTRALAKLAHQLPAYDARSAHDQSRFSHFRSLNFFKFYRALRSNLAPTLRYSKFYASSRDA